MENGNKILFWFRENLSLEGNQGLCKALQESSGIIPVYCFDPREREIPPVSNNMFNFMNEQIKEVNSLRKSLQKKGSNLLVVHDHFEKIIPSLARVLKVNSVVTNELTLIEKSMNQPLTEFRNRKALEIQYRLNSHSIAILFEGPCAPDSQLPATFPSFPEINPGTIAPEYLQGNFLKANRW